MKSWMRTSLALLVGMGLSGAVIAADFKVGVVDMNRAINDSEAGVRSRNQLEGKFRDREKELKAEDETISRQEEELRNNVLLTPESKKQKEMELHEKRRGFQEKVTRFQQEVRSEERELVEKINKELRVSIRSVSMQEKLDLVVEKNMAEAILFAAQAPSDLTQKVIDHYNNLQPEGSKSSSPSEGSKKK